MYTCRPLRQHREAFVFRGSLYSRSHRCCEGWYDAFSFQSVRKRKLTIITTGYYNGVPDDSFDEHRKCAYSSNYHMIIPPATTIPPQQHFDKLLILMMSVTGGAYFQHFIDRGLSILVQAWSMLQKDPDIKLLVSPIFDRHPIVPQIYERLGLKDRLVYRSLLPITASKMYFSCVSPHYHPYVYQKVRCQKRCTHCSRTPPSGEGYIRN